MRKIYYLGTCDTCRKILKEWEPGADVILQDIKKEPLTQADVEQMYALIKSYEELLNKRATLYKERGLGGKKLQENEIKDLLLEHYTFLKRPVLILDGRIFAGNSKSTVAEAKQALHE